jgi:hypothetical protein
VVGASVLGVVDRGDERAEADGESRAEWAAFDGSHRKRRDAFSHGRQHRREVAAASAQLARGAAHRVAAACMACGGREVGGARRSGSWRGRNSTQACTCKPMTGWAGLVYAGVALGQFRNRAGPH